MRFAAVKIIACAVAVTLTASAASAQTVAKTLNNPKVSAHRGFGSAGTGSVVKDAAVEGGSAFRLVVTQAGAKPWAAGVSSYIGGKTNVAERVKASFWVRLAKADGSKPGEVSVAVQLSGAPRTQYVNKKVAIGDQWTLHDVEFVAPVEFAPYATVFMLYAAYGEQTVDVGPITVVNLGPAS